MSTQFLSKLSQNFIELLEDDEYYDITIEVGKDSNVKIFHAHMNILCYRSPYLRLNLASNKNNKKNKDNVLAHIKLSNIMPEIFQIILSEMFIISDQNSISVLHNHPGLVKKNIAELLI
ncbi:BTB/POZ protein [Rhizophagus irregularis DAOM 181602=DAOM 197198]|nr:BTB/POZ protein [Rhizophagus irregularis DAOM 181602=DAOM 197198]